MGLSGGVSVRDLFSEICAHTHTHKRSAQDELGFHEVLQKSGTWFGKRKLDVETSGDLQELSESVKPSVTVKECDISLRNSLLSNSCEHMHRCIPKPYLLTWIKNLESYLDTVAGGGLDLDMGCSCSGTGIWSRVCDLLLQHWKSEYDINDRYVWSHKFMCEIEPRKQAFLLSQFDVEYMFKDVTTLAAGPAFDCISGKVQPLPNVAKYGSGFSCKDLFLLG